MKYAAETTVTVGEWMAPQIEQSYQSGRMPPLMLTMGDDETIQ